MLSDHAAGQGGQARRGHACQLHDASSRVTGAGLRTQFPDELYKRGGVHVARHVHIAQAHDTVARVAPLGLTRCSDNMRDLPARLDVPDADAVELAPLSEPSVLKPKAEPRCDVHREAVLGGVGERRRRAWRKRRRRAWRERRQGWRERRQGWRERRQGWCGQR